MSNSTQHTPGPWHAHHDHGWLVVESQNGDLYIRLIKGSSTQQHMADALLIAAAPELLEACLAMVEWDDREKDHAVDFHARMALCAKAFDKARAAIAKATGSAS